MNLLIRDTTLFTADPAQPLLKHHDLQTRGNRIDCIRPHDPNAALPPDCRSLDGSHLILLPGLINSHTHSYMTLFRNFGSGLVLQDWLHTKIFPAEGRLTAEDCRWGMAMGLAEMIRSGITGFADMPILGEAGLDLLEASGMRAAIGFSIFHTEFNPYSCQTIFPAFEALYRSCHGRANGRLRAQAIIHSGYLYPPEQLAEAAAWLRQTGYRIHTHLHETASEVTDDLQQFGQTPIQRFAELGLLTPGSIAAHCVHLNEEDLRLLAQSGVLAVPCPYSNLRLSAGIPDLVQLRQYGVRTALGTDSCSSGGSLNLWKELRLAGLLSASHYQPGVLSDAQLLKLVTVVPSQALFAEADRPIGLLQPGAAADFIGVNTDAPHFTPLGDIASALVQQTQPADIQLSVADGAVLLEQGELQTLDLEQIQYETARRAVRLTAGL